MKSCCFVVLLLLVAAVADEPSPPPQTRVCTICTRLAATIASASDTSSGFIGAYLTALRNVCTRIPSDDLKKNCFGVVDQAKTIIDTASGQTEGLCDAVCNEGLTGAELEQFVAYKGFSEVSSAEENSVASCRYCKMLFALIKESLDFDSLFEQAKASITSLCVTSGVGDEKDCREAVEEAAGSVTFPDAKSACVTARLCRKHASVLTT